MTQLGTVSLKGLYIEGFLYTFLAEASITEADEGKAVALDTSAANTVKLAADDEVIIGRIERFEDRSIEGVKVATVVLEGGHSFPIDSGLAAIDVPDVGEYLHGAPTAGTVKGSATASRWLCVEVADDDSYAVAISV